MNSEKTYLLEALRPDLDHQKEGHLLHHQEEGTVPNQLVEKVPTDWLHRKGELAH